MSLRRDALKLALLTTALALIALACAPAAPAGQGEAAGATTPAEATVTATNTSVPEPTPSPTPPVTPDLTKLGMDTEAVIAFLDIQTPYAALIGDAAPVIPPIKLPSLITVSISTLDLEATRRFLEANGGVITERFQPPNADNWVIFAEMPPSLLPALSRQSEIRHAFVYDIYEKVDNRIGVLLIEEAVAYFNDPTRTYYGGGITVVIQATPEGYDNVRSFLKSYGIPVTYQDFGDTTHIQAIPLNLIVPVSELPGIVRIYPLPIARPAGLPEPRSHQQGQTHPFVSYYDAIRRLLFRHKGTT